MSWGSSPRTRWGRRAWWRAGALLTLLYTALLLRYRVVDEWKDFRHDSRFYPGRPVPRGSISVRALATLGALGSSRKSGRCSRWAGCEASRSTRPWWCCPFSPHSSTSPRRGSTRTSRRLSWFTSWCTCRCSPGPLASSERRCPSTRGSGWRSATALFASAEVVRKFQPRHDTEGAAVADTYSVVWGRPAALTIVVVLIVVAGGLAHLVATGWLSVGSVGTRGNRDPDEPSIGLVGHGGRGRACPPPRIGDARVTAPPLGAKAAGLTALAASYPRLVPPFVAIPLAERRRKLARSEERRRRHARPVSRGKGEPGEGLRV